MSPTIPFNIRGNPYLNSIAECPNKGAYNLMDLEKRTARYYLQEKYHNPAIQHSPLPPRFFNIPFKMKEDPISLIGVIGSLQQQRFITAVLKVIPT